MANKQALNRSIVAKPSASFDRDRPRRVPFGLGAPNPESVQNPMEVAERCIRCSFGNIPVIEEVVWTIPLPLTADEALAVFGETVNPLSGSSNVPGVASIDSTFLINGILQTDILAQGLGCHIFCEPMSGATIGNAFTAPSTSQAPPPSPDVFTANDLASGALGTSVETDGSNFGPAVFEFGTAVWKAGWNFINAYQFQWRTSQRELVINELASDVSYFGSFADAAAAGTSEVPIIEFVAAVNAIYRSKGAASIFIPISFRRVGSVTVAGANVGVFHPTRDFDLMPVTWGGLKWQGSGCKGQMYRPIESPCFIERGIPIGMQFISQDAVHQAQLLEAVTIDNEPFGVNVEIDTNLTCTTNGGAGNAMLEQTLDAVPVNSSQQTNVCRQVFKGGILKIGIKIKGWEMPGGWKAFCSKMPQVMAAKAG